MGKRFIDGLAGADPPMTREDLIEVETAARTLRDERSLEALRAVQRIIENTYAHDAAGNRVDELNPSFSAADIVDQLLEIEQQIEEAIGHAI